MINWHLFSQAIIAYSQMGYKLIEVPWLVDEETIKVTLPSKCKPFTVNGCGSLNQLVGSAEQSFIYLALQGKLTDGKYMALTPCFRDDEVDELHHKYFMKLELIDLGGRFYNNMIRDAKEVLSKFTFKEIKHISTSEGSDLTIDNIEIGSYGIRSYKNIQWVYGTGLAEPRFSKVNV